MDDLISRAQAIDAVVRVREHHAYDEIEELKALPSAQQDCTECAEYDHERHYCQKYCDVIRRTLEEAKQERTGRWIPVSERLPENGHYYLKCSKYGNVNVDYYWNGFEQSQKYGEEVIAWMPKPKPYREGES